MLPEAVAEKIQTELPEHIKRFKQVDKEIRDSMSAHLSAEKQAKFDKFMKKYLGPKLEKYATQKVDREKILGHPEFVEADYEVKEYYEEILVEETLVPIEKPADAAVPGKK